MAVYVDDMYQYPLGQFGRMKMSHLMADTTAELLEMATTIGVAHRWIQHPGTRQEHFDIAMSKRTAAIAAGAIPVTLRQLATASALREATGRLPIDLSAEEIKARFAARRVASKS